MVVQTAPRRNGRKAFFGALVLACVGAAGSGAAIASDWPQWGGPTGPARIKLGSLVVVDCTSRFAVRLLKRHRSARSAE